MAPAEGDLDNGFDPHAPIGDSDLEAAMHRDPCSVLRADMVVVSPECRASARYGTEVHMARVIGTPVVGYPDLTPVEDEPNALETHWIVDGARQSTYEHPMEDFARAGSSARPVAAVDGD